MSLKAKIASLVVELAANSASFNSELAKSKKEAHTWAKEIKGYAKIGAGSIAATAAVTSAALTVLIKQQMTSIDATAKHADKLGITTQALAGLRHQAELNGVSQEKLDMGLQRMVRRVAEAAGGTGEAVSALAELNINAAELNRLSPDQQFSKIADEMMRVQDQGDRVRLTFKLFDSEGVGLVNAMRDGSKGIAAAAAEAEALGLAVNRIDAAKIEAANDAGYRADKVFTGLGNTLAIAVAPYITEIKNEFFNSAKESNGFKDAVNDGMKIVIKSIGLVSNSVRGMQLMWKGAQLLVATFVAQSLENLNWLAQKTLDVINLMPGVNVQLDPNSGISLFAEVAAARVEELKKEMHDLAMQEPPSEKIKAWAETAVKNSEKYAEAVAKVTSAASEPKNNPASELTTKYSNSALDAVIAELSKVDEYYLDAYQRRQDMLDEALKKKQMSEDAHFKTSEKNWKNYQKAIADEVSARHQMMVDSSKGFFADLATLSDHGNKTLARIGRASARINVAISTIEAAQNAYTWAAKWGGVPAGVAAATAATIAGLMRLRQINMAGSGTGSSGSGGLSGGTTFDQSLPDTAATAATVPAVADRRSEQASVVVQGDYIANVSAIDSQSYAEAAMRNRGAIAEATESHLNEYGRSLVV